MSPAISPWVLCSTVLVIALVPCARMVFHGTAFDRLVGLEMATVVMSLAMLTLAEAFGRGAFVDLAVALSLLSFGGGLVFVRTMERWL